MNSMWWPPNGSLGGTINQSIFLILSALSAFNYVMATLCGPGFLPLKWQPAVKKHQFRQLLMLLILSFFCILQDKKGKKYLQYCTICEGYKAPRSHHCRKCGRCVMKMDHHCPWLNGVCICICIYSTGTTISKTPFSNIHFFLSYSVSVGIITLISHVFFCFPLLEVFSQQLF